MKLTFFPVIARHRRWASTAEGAHQDQANTAYSTSGARNEGLILLCGFLLTACSTLSGPPLGSATPRPPTPTPVLSPTPVWFPPSETPTPRSLASPTATPDFRPGLGNTIKVDNFTDEAVWEIRASDEGAVSLISGNIIVSASPGQYFTSLNQELVLTDFHAEVTARLNLCRGADEYGVLVRAIPITYYRFTLTCDGQVRADRVSGDERNPLELPHFTGDAPRGAPAEVRIAVWAVGREMRFFLNGHFQYAVTDANLRSGTIGFFVRAAGRTPITVLFSDLIVQEVNYSALPTSTPKP